MRLFALLFATVAAVVLARAQPNTINVTPGENLASIVNAAPEGSVIRIQSGRYPIAPTEVLKPGRNVTLEGIGDVVIHGSRLLENWNMVSATRFEVGGQQQENFIYTNPDWQVCESTHPRCNRPDDVYMNSVPLKHVDALSKLVPGTFFFDYPNNVIAVGSNPVGAVMEAAITPFAVQSSATGVILRNLTFEKFATPIERAALELNGSGPLVDNVTVRLSHGNGVVVRDGSTVRGSRLVDNGQSGGGAGGIGALYEDNIISGNNYARVAKSFSAGGFSKAARTTGFIFRRNQVFNNLGDGVWLDVENQNALVEGNTVYNNLGTGIFHEIGYSARILSNVVYCNEGYGQINVTSSVGTEANPIVIAGNTITVCGKGEALSIREDGSRNRQTDWVTVVSNVFHFPNNRGKVVLDAWSGAELGSNISFTGNTYNVQRTDTRHWRYDNTDQYWEAWSSKYGGETRLIVEPFPMTPTRTNTIVITNTFTPTNTVVISATFEPTLTPTQTPASVTVSPTSSNTLTPEITQTATPEPDIVWRFEIDVVFRGWKLSD